MFIDALWKTQGRKLNWMLSPVRNGERYGPWVLMIDLRSKFSANRWVSECFSSLYLEQCYHQTSKICQALVCCLSAICLMELTALIFFHCRSSSAFSLVSLKRRVFLPSDILMPYWKAALKGKTSSQHIPTPLLHFQFTKEVMGGELKLAYAFELE